MSNSHDISLFFPTPATFPSISVTGSWCGLMCDHCGARFLHTMADGTRGGIYRSCRNAYENGAHGALVTGGSTMNGAVPIDYDELERACTLTPFHINVHAGLSEEVPPTLRSVSAVSIDIPPSTRVVHEVYHLDRTQDDYFSMVEALEEAQVHYVPHICIGAEWGTVRGEGQTLERLASYGCEEVILLSLRIPPGGGDMFKHVTAHEFEDTIKKAREMFKCIGLGCMRDRTPEKERMWHYFDKIAWPSKIVKDELAQSERTFHTYETCCAV